MLQKWLARVEVKTAYITPGSPWKNGYNERFNGTFGDELLDREIFYTLREAQILIETWRKEYNEIRPRSTRTKIACASCQNTNFRCGT